MPRLINSLYRATLCSVMAACLAAPGQAQSSPSRSDALSRDTLIDILHDQTPEARALSASQQETLFSAAGMQRLRNGNWTGCSDDPSGHSQGVVALYQDLNGDGRPEAVLRDDGTFCSGHVGSSSMVLTQQTDGSWTTMYKNQGHVSFLRSRGKDGFPDLTVDLPGLCFPFFRWDGSEYQMIATLDPQGQPCEPG